MRGVWAFALYDLNKGMLMLCRDRLGVKPLYYLQLGEKFFFASEIKAILEYREYIPEVDLNALKNFLSFRYNNSNQTLFKDIKKLPPATTMTIFKKGTEFDVSHPEIREYWFPDIREELSKEFINPENGRPDLTLVSQHLRALLEESVRMRLMSEVPLGVYLSGGIDSSSIVAMMKKEVETPVTYSIGFGEDVNDEIEYSRFVAEHFGTEHHEIIVEPEATEVVAKTIYYLDEPMADFATIPVYLMSEKAKKDLTVVLTGEGNDEIWGGYENYRRQLKYLKWRQLVPSFLKRFFFSFANTFPERIGGKKLSHYASFLDENLSVLGRAPVFNEFETLFKKEVYEKIDKTPPSLEVSERYFKNNFSLLTKMLLSDMKTLLPNSYLVKADRMTMAHGMEARVPLIDHRIVEFSFQLPPLLKIDRDKEKYIFRIAVKDLLPKKIIKRRKQGFSVPKSRWVSSARELVENLLTEKTTLKRGYFNQEYINKLLKNIKELDDLRAQKI
ncbi:MAG TPA: asparagine synthase (glutamine-hydrolyzing), partial [Thermoplasmata archaeon]|nr:asparagine synthase (glutamine-hydrolyzing) [Thermoplasmata archaeon]